MNPHATPMTVTAKHIAIIAPPTSGHLNPLAALARALTREGHRTTFVHLADVARLLPEGVAFAPLDGADPTSAMLDKFLGTLARADGPIGRSRMIAATAGMSDTLLRRLPATLRRIGADAVIADSAEAAGGLVARHLGLPFVTSVTGLPLLRDPMVPPPFVGWPYRQDEGAQSRNRGGYAVAGFLMRPITRVLRRHARRWRLPLDTVEAFSPLLQVAQCPAALDFPRIALPAAFRYGAPWRSAEAPAALPPLDGRPLVYCSLGSLQGARRRLFATMTAACASVGARAVVAHGGGLSDAEAAALPGDPIVRPYWSQAPVLRQCAAAILHGGFNTVLDALAAGVPIVAVPIAFEQPGTAARIEWSGAGRTVPPAKARHRLADTLGEVMSDPAYRVAAHRIAGTMAFDGAVHAAGLVSAALSAGSRPS